jgi:hypothetical protein
LYDPQTLALPLNPFQRAYIYALKLGLDAVNSDMQSFDHLEENLRAAAVAS